MADGANRKVNETYLVDAMSFTEAEARIIGEMKAFISGEFMVLDISRARLDEVVPSDKESADKWYKIKVAYITLDEKKGKERKSYHNKLINSCSTNDAEKDLHEMMKGTLADYQIVKVEETPIMDVFFYAEEKETDENR